MTHTLSLDEAADVLKTTPETVSDAIRFKGLPAAKIGRAWVLVDDDVIAWLRTQYQAPAVRQTAAAGVPTEAAGASAAALREALAPHLKGRRRS